MKFFIMCLVLFIILIIVILLKYSDTMEHFQNSYVELASSDNEAEADPTVTFSNNTFKGSDGEFINKDRIIKAYKVGSKYKFKGSEVEKSFPNAVKDKNVSNNDMSVICWQAADKMYQVVSEQEKNIKKLQKKLKRIERNLGTIEEKCEDYVKELEKPTVNTDNTMNDIKGFSSNL